MSFDCNNKTTLDRYLYVKHFHSWKMNEDNFLVVKIPVRSPTQKYIYSMNELQDIFQHKEVNYVHFLSVMFPYKVVSLIRRLLYF